MHLVGKNSLTGGMDAPTLNPNRLVNAKLLGKYLRLKELGSIGNSRNRTSVIRGDSARGALSRSEVAK